MCGPTTNPSDVRFQGDSGNTILSWIGFPAFEGYPDVKRFRRGESVGYRVNQTDPEGQRNLRGVIVCSMRPLRKRCRVEEMQDARKRRTRRP
jgi:hypothetical protein